MLGQRSSSVYLHTRSNSWLWRAALPPPPTSCSLEDTLRRRGMTMVRYFRGTARDFNLEHLPSWPDDVLVVYAREGKLGAIAGGEEVGVAALG